MDTIKPSQRELEVILNSTHDAMVSVNANGIINMLNSGAERILGVAASNAIGKLAHDTIPGTRLHVVLKTGVPELNQQQMIGEVRVITNRVPVRDENERVIGAVAVFRDITDLRQLAEEITNLKEIQQMLEAIINYSQDVISVVDEQGKGILVNPAYTRLVGLCREEIIGKPATIDIIEGESMHLKVLRTGEPVWGVPMKVGPMKKDVIVNAAPFYVNGVLKGSVAVAHDITEIKKLTEELDRVKSLVRHLHAKYSFEDIVADSPEMHIVVDQARRAATTPVTVLLGGESGTGKELFAHAIHLTSQRYAEPFIRVNCAAIAESLLESELFGYDEGAFTGAKRGGKKGYFEEAHNGTLFLDEIGELPLGIQAKLLRVLQEREIIRVGGSKAKSIDVRIIAATNQNLEAAVNKGLFREDLYYRVNVFPILIPPLRHRTGDLPKIIRFLLNKLNQQYGRNVLSVSPGALTILEQYRWPGNVRELENVLGRALINMRFNEEVILLEHLPSLGREHYAILSTMKGEKRDACPTLDDAVCAAEREAIRCALLASNGNKNEAARRLEIAPRSLYYKLEKYKI
jgi:PAS domain S-box-containing protein